MINQFVLIGKMTSLPNEKEDGTIQITVKSDEKSFVLNIWEGIAKVINDQYELETLVAAKGHLEPMAEGAKLVCERLSFITPEDE